MESNKIKDNTLVLCRGIPGSGKSFVANKLYKESFVDGKCAIICSSDNFFMKDGVYKFDLNKLGQAHKYCQEKCRIALESKIDIVIIDNTNVSCKECKIYVEMGLAHNYNIKFIEPDTWWKFNLDELEKRNQHNVPRHALERMLRRWVPDMTVEKALGHQQKSEGMHEDEKAAHQAYLDGSDLASGLTRRGQMFYKMYEERFGKKNEI